LKMQQRKWVSRNAYELAKWEEPKDS